jgi:hypothetical protein
MALNPEKTIVTVKPTAIKPDAKPSEFGFNQIFDMAQDDALLDTLSSLADTLMRGESCACFTMNQNPADV